VDFVVVYQLLMGYSAQKWECNGTEHQLFMDIEKAYDLVEREVRTMFSLNLVYL